MFGTRGTAPGGIGGGTGGGKRGDGWGAGSPARDASKAVGADRGKSKKTAGFVKDGDSTQLIDYDNWTEEQRRARTAANLQKRILPPEELGPMAVLLASEEGHSITGQVVRVDGGDWV